jgi:hypothetical protein
MAHWVQVPTHTWFVRSRFCRHSSSCFRAETGDSEGREQMNLYRAYTWGNIEVNRQCLSSLRRCGHPIWLPLKKGFIQWDSQRKADIGLDWLVWSIWQMTQSSGIWFGFPSQTRIVSVNSSKCHSGSSTDRRNGQIYLSRFSGYGHRNVNEHMASLSTKCEVHRELEVQQDAGTLNREPSWNSDIRVRWTWGIER